MSSDVSRSSAFPMSATLLIAVGVLIAAWTAGSRLLFGWTGSIALILAVTIAPIGAVLHIVAGLYVHKATRIGHSVRRAIVAAVLSAASGLLFGATVPENTAEGLRSLMAPAGEGWATEMSIAFCNPLAVIYVATSIATVIFARLAVRGPRISEEDDVYPA